MNEQSISLATEAIANRIATLRGQRVIVDADLAMLYDVTTKRLNEQVRRNAERFPADFMFQLSNDEFESLRSQFATSNETRSQRGGRRYAPLVFTEHGAIMAATITVGVIHLSPRRCGMTDETTNIIIELLRAIRGDLAKLTDKVDGLTQRVGSPERQVAIVHDDMAGIQMRLDKHDIRLDRIEHQLYLIPN